MRMSRGVRSLAGAGLIVALVGCSFRTADLTVISTRNVNLDRVDLDRLPGRRVTGTASKWNVLGIPLGVPHLEDAIDDALNQGNGDLVTDGVVHLSHWTAILFGKSTIRVEGEVVKTRGAEGGAP